MSPGFQKQDFMHLTFPVQMFIDYIRVYQREDVISEDSISCSPSSHPTADYITKCVSFLDYGSWTVADVRSAAAT